MSLACSVGRRGEQLGAPNKPADGRNVRAVEQEDEEGREPDESSGVCVWEDCITDVACFGYHCC